MNARDLLRDGAAREALAALKQEVRQVPRDARLRTFLFQLFCVFGEWERALTQLDAAAALDPQTVPMQHAYRAAIRCEVLRSRVFAGARTPTILGAPEPWMPLLIEALRGLAAGRAAEAAALRDQAFEAAPASAGTCDGVPFAWIADADPRLGPMLEAFIDGKYYWVPFLRVATLQIEAPADLRDYVWMPAQFVWTNGGEAVGFVPTRYPGSERQEDAALARRTEWQDAGAGWFLGLGQRMLATDTGEVALMDIRRVAFAAANAD
jgi:type VI secretion system protein ImpE